MAQSVIFRVKDKSSGARWSAGPDGDALYWTVLSLNGRDAHAALAAAEWGETAAPGDTLDAGPVAVRCEDESWAAFDGGDLFTANP
jgi:hypothetical protein